MSEWTSTRDSLPPPHERVLFLDAAEIVWVGWYSSGEWHRYSDERDFPRLVTHWMPAPEPPR